MVDVRCSVVEPRAGSAGAWPALVVLLLTCAPAYAQPDASSSALGAIIDSTSDVVTQSDVVTTLAPLDTTALQESFKKMARLRNQEAIRFNEQGDFPRALEALRAAHNLAPDDAEIINNLAFLLDKLGNHAEAEDFYRLAIKLDPTRYVAHVNLADLLFQKEENEEVLSRVAQLLIRARELKGNRPSVILRQARVAARRGRFQEAERHYREYRALSELTDDKRIEMGDFYRDFGRREEARRWYDQVTGDGEAARQAAQRLWQLATEQEARRFGWRPHNETVPASARELAARGRIQSTQRDFSQAERLFREALEVAPQFSRARLGLGDVLRDTDRIEEAEVEYLRALALDSRNAEIHVRLGELYLDSGSRRRAGEAALFLSHALQLRPEWSALHLKLARAHQLGGNLAGALNHVNLFLADTASDEEKEEALLLKQALLTVLGTEAEEFGQDNPTDSARLVSNTVMDCLNRARLYTTQNRLDAAMAELEKVPADERGLEFHNARGRVLFAAGRHEEALESFTASLAIEEGQAEANELVGQIHSASGADGLAAKHYRRAEELGSPTATYYLVRMELGFEESGLLGGLKDLLSPLELLQVRSRLDRFLGTPGNSVYYEEAVALRDRVDRRLRSVAVAASVLLALLFATILLVWVRLRGGASLQQLIERHPEAGPEVQRVMAAIRHEVLKHNTMVLTGLVEALESGADVADKAAYLRESLFGQSRGDAVLGHLLTYKQQLEKTGRSFGLRLNLRRNDPALSAILRGFELLERASPQLDRAEFLTDAHRERLLKTLREATRLLNVEGYEAVRSLLDRLRILQVDRELLEGIFSRIRREPALSSHKVAPPVMSLEVEMPCGVLIPRPALEDILGNLVRNAILSAVNHGEEEAVVGLDVEEDVDPITGLESVIFRVKDRSPQTLTTEMIRGRYIEGGLGLAADLVAKFEGTIDVEALSGEWAKGVVVKFPRADG